MARRRGLTSEDRALWDHVTQSVAPLHPQGCRPLPGAAEPGKPAATDSRAQAKAKMGKAFGPSGAKQAGTGPNGTAAPPIPAPAPFRLTSDMSGLPKPRLSSFTPAPTPAQDLAAQPVRMGHKTHRQMTQGKLRPEARIDLHGMTLAIAHPELIRFLMTSHTRGFRLVLVITGKGKAGSPDAPLPVRPGALRHNVPHWLRMMPLARIVLQATPAHRRHGGEGAFYVYLRKSGVRP